MRIVRHRRNTAQELQETSAALGVEVDIRSDGGELVVHHDPFARGERFEDWLRHYRHGLLILNVKEEGLEERLEALMAEHGIDEWFFLDQSFPFLMRTVQRGEARCAVRVSEFESVDTALSLAGMARWVWVDCFTKFPLETASAARLRAAGFSLCLVSPELQGRDPVSEVPEMRELLKAREIVVDAVCTKVPELWA